jgi:signal transduction histidine kinase
VPLSCLAREALDLVATRIGKSGVAVSIPPDLPVVCGDRPRLLSVMQNLLDNAAKFMGDQPEPNIQIGARMDGDEAICWVRDNGIGIDPRYHERIFGLFEKLNSDSKEGTGIGLALAKRIVEAHGGRIWVESDGRGRGATFYFSIPRKGGLAHDTIAKP